MSLFAQVQSGFTQAQSLLAQMSGLPATAAGNTLYQGATLTGVYGQPRIEERMLPGGGYRRRAVVPLSVTRGQLTAAPAPQATIVRTDLTPHIGYRIDDVDTHDPHHYRLTLVKLGE